MIALGTASLLFGGMMFLLALLLPSMRGQPEFREAFEQLKIYEQNGIDVQQQFYAGAATMALYAVVSIVVALLLRRGTRGPVTTSLVLAGIALGVLALNLIASFKTPSPLALPIAVLFLGVHALLLNWLLAARRNVPLIERGGGPVTPGLTIPAPPTSTAPMAGYYAELQPAPPPR
jgi:hypothetical protein